MKLITVANFYYLNEAYPFKTLLENEGIPCFLPDEQTMNALPFHGIALGGVRLQVEEEHAEKAIEMLKEHGFENTHLQAPSVFNEKKAGYSPVDNICPNCDHRGVYMKKLSFRQIVLSLLIIPIIFLKREYYCNNCQHQWQN